MTSSATSHAPTSASSLVPMNEREHQIAEQARLEERARIFVAVQEVFAHTGDVAEEEVDHVIDSTLVSPEDPGKDRFLRGDSPQDNVAAYLGQIEYVQQRAAEIAQAKQARDARLDAFERDALPLKLSRRR